MRTLATTEEVRLQEPRDFVGAAYDDIVAAATESFWVVPMNTDDLNFAKFWRIADVSQEGLVAYVYMPPARKAAK